MRKLAFTTAVLPYRPLIHNLTPKVNLRFRTLELVWTLVIGLQTSFFCLHCVVEPGFVAQLRSRTYVLFKQKADCFRHKDQNPNKLLHFAVLQFYILHFAVLHFTFPSLSAQSGPHPSFRQYTTDEGLASSEVFYILQDLEGIIWISTDNGVSRFDGYGFRNYGLKEGLVENVIYTMQLDTLGRLWMQAMSGNLYYMNGDTILPYWHNKVLLNFKDRPDTGTGFIVEGAGETVHIATFKYGIISISHDGSTAITVQEEPVYSQVFKKNEKAIFAIFNNGEPEELEAFKNQLLSHHFCLPVYFNINEEEWSLTKLEYSFQKFYTPEVFSLGHDKYLFQMYHDLWLIEDRKVTQKQTFPYNILYARIMNKGQLFVGLYGHRGLRVYKSMDAFREKETSTWLPGQSVNFFMEDREGGRWFATHEDGVFYAPADAFMVYDQEAGLPDKKITALAIKNADELFVGLENGDVWRLYTLAERWEKLPNIPGTGAIRDLYFSNQTQQLWVGRDKLFYWHNGQWQYIQTAHPDVPFTIADRIKSSPGEKRFWLSNYRGFMSLDLPQKVTANFHFGRDQRTCAILEDFSGKVWIGRPTGLFEWKDGTLLDRQNLHPAFSLRVEDFALMPDSSLVIATKGGGVVFWNGDQFEQITTEQGLTADMMECLYVDKNGIVWAGTLNGLNRITGNWGNREVEQITIFHGLPSNEINRVRTHGENVWVATSKGLVHFANKKKSKFSPKPIFTAVLTNNKAIDFTKPIVLQSDENNLNISFFAINYKMNGKIPFRYRLDGSGWTQTFNRSLNFPALPTGKCVFEVQAQNEDGIWSDSLQLPFVINPPWWGTWWARILMGLTVVTAGLSLYLFRTRQLKKEHQIQMKIAELERAALQAQMNPHFIFNCLNSIQSFILQNEKEAAIMYLGSFASLVRSTLNASVTGKILLVEEVKLLTNYLELEKLRFKNRFTYEIQADEGLDVFEVKIPPLLVQPYVENALLHGISGKESEGKVRVFFEKKERHIEVSIEDNGKGFQTPDQQENHSKVKKSFGMSITRHRLELLSHKKESNAVIAHNLHDENGQISGTKITIRVNIDAEFAD